MLVVETIARIRRERLIKGKTIKEIARDLKVSRNTVRRVLRSGETRFEYEREVQPRPKLGRWTDELDGLLADNAAKSAREQLTLIRVFEELRGRGYEGGYDAVRRYARRCAKERGHWTAAAYVPLSFAGGGLSVRLEPRDRPAERSDGDREGGSRAALPQPDVVRAGLSAGDAGDGVRCPRPGLRPVQGNLRPGHLRQHEDGRGDDLCRQAPPLQSALPADVQSLSHRSGGLHAGVGLGEGPGREPGRAGPRALLHAAAAVQDPRRAECLAAR
jgi:transcriptional regulator with XRE-family HTH domain